MTVMTNGWLFSVSACGIQSIVREGHTITAELALKLPLRLSSPSMGTFKEFVDEICPKCDKTKLASEYLVLRW